MNEVNWQELAQSYEADLKRVADRFGGCEPDQLGDLVTVISIEVELLREVEKAVKSLFNGSRKWMSDGDKDQWEAFDYLATCYAKQPVQIPSPKDTGASDANE